MMTIEEISMADVKEIAIMENKYMYAPYSLSVINEMLKNPNCIGFKVVEDGVTAGYISGQMVIDEFNINNVVVKENYRRKGYATALIEKVIERCKAENIKKLYLEVAQSNDAARKLYEKMGFKFSYERKKYYGNQSALVLIKSI